MHRTYSFDSFFVICLQMYYFFMNYTNNLISFLSIATDLETKSKENRQYMPHGCLPTATIRTIASRFGWLSYATLSDSNNKKSVPERTCTLSYFSYKY